MDDFIYQFREVSCFDEWLFDDFDFCFPIGGYSRRLLDVRDLE